MIWAIKDIKELTFLCEYSGNVRTRRQTIGSTNDSIMILLDTNSSETSLNCICETHANIGKYFSGINNHSEESLWKQNCRIVWFDIEGEARNIIYAYSNIKAGDICYVDYNEGLDEYPTHYFV